MTARRSSAVSYTDGSTCLRIYRPTQSQPLVVLAPTISMFLDDAASDVNFCQRLGISLSNFCYVFLIQKFDRYMAAVTICYQKPPLSLSFIFCERVKYLLKPG
jgi:hypothetical protein